MGYITTVLTAEERRRGWSQERRAGDSHRRARSAGRRSACTSLRHRKGKATAPCWRKLSPMRSALRRRDIRTVSEIDTARDAWSIASGNYSSRFARGGRRRRAPCRNAAQGKARAHSSRAAQCTAGRDRICRRTRACARQSGQQRSVRAARRYQPLVARRGRPTTIRRCARRVFWTPPELTAPTEADEVNSSLCHGFIFDFCGVEVDRVTGAVRVDKYVTMHDCGRVLHPGHGCGSDHRRLRAGDRRRTLRRVRLLAETALFSPVPSPTISCQPALKSPSPSSCTSRHPRRSRRLAPRASAKAIA